MLTGVSFRARLSKRDWGELARLFKRLREVQGGRAAREALADLARFLETKNAAALASLEEAGEDLIALHKLEAPSTLHTSLLSTNMSSGGQLGDKYPLVVKSVRDAIAHLPEIVPGYEKDKGYEIVGFFWNQGLSDTSAEYADEYEQNLVNLIKDLRTEFKAPDMKVVVAVTGNYGWDLADLLQWQKTQEEKDAVAARYRKVTGAQVAVSRRPEFKATVATAETRDFWRPQEQYGGNKQGVHWHANGESYWLIGEAMGHEMVRLLDAKE